MNEKHEKRQLLPVVWAFMLGSLAIYAALPLFIPGSEQPPATAIPFIMAAAALMTAMLAFLIPHAMRRVPSRDEAEAAQRQFQAKVIQWALHESIGIFGLVLYMLGAGTTWLWSFCAFAALLMAAHAPREFAVPSDSRDLVRPDAKIG